ncbi:DUF1656 domain-containing protein [Bosea thiooxidans]|nr:DUF1656 domain-containing protein [Bosea sp. (in: a-proteobacteria)]
MKPDLDILGVYVPTLLVTLLGCYVIFHGIRRLLSAAGFYRHVWHPALFDIAFYFSLLGTCVLFLSKTTS